MESAEPVRRGGRRAKTAAKEASAAKPADKVVELQKLVVEEKPAETTSEAKSEPKSEPKSEAKPEVTTALSVQPPAEKPAKREPVQITASGSIFDRPIGPGSIEIYESISVAGMRPIASSDLKVYATILNDRPIMASDIEVLDVTIPGQRPVFSSSLVVRDDLTLPGGRPIIASDVRLLEAELLPGGRPIASNDIDNDMEDFIGYID